MQHIYSLQRQHRKRGSSATASVSFTEPTRLFAPATFPSSPMLSHERQGHLPHVAQFRHAFDRISILPPDSSGGAGYRVERSDMRQTGTQPFSIQRKEGRRQPITPEGTPLQKVAQTSPASGDTYTIQPGDTLGNIAVAHNTTWQVLAQHNQIVNPNLIYPGQQLNIPGSRSNDAAPQPVSTPAPVNTPEPVNAPQPEGKIPEHNTANLFPPGQCTWWANERYYQLTGYYVPWTTNSNANQWTARAQEFGWHVSDQPSVGAIIDFQAGVQLASEVGHVAIVEKINSDGSLTTSNMNVLGQPGKVVDLTNHPGPGVTFITYS